MFSTTSGSHVLKCFDATPDLTHPNSGKNASASSFDKCFRKSVGLRSRCDLLRPGAVATHFPRSKAPVFVSHFVVVGYFSAFFCPRLCVLFEALGGAFAAGAFRFVIAHLPPPTSQPPHHFSPPSLSAISGPVFWPPPFSRPTLPAWQLFGSSAAVHPALIPMSAEGGQSCTSAAPPPLSSSPSPSGGHSARSAAVGPTSGSRHVLLPPLNTEFNSIL